MRVFISQKKTSGTEGQSENKLWLEEIQFLKQGQNDVEDDFNLDCPVNAIEHLAHSILGSIKPGTIAQQDVVEKEQASREVIKKRQGVTMVLRRGAREKRAHYEQANDNAGSISRVDPKEAIPEVALLGGRGQATPCDKEAADDEEDKDSVDSKDLSCQRFNGLVALFTLGNEERM